MSVALAIVDVVLVASLLALAWRALRGEDLFASCVLYVAFGLVMALAWVRLRAPDVALAEAAIGSGITGALLIGALRGLDSRSASTGEHAQGEEDVDRGA